MNGADKLRPCYKKLLADILVIIFIIALLVTVVLIHITWQSDCVWICENCGTHKILDKYAFPSGSVSCFRYSPLELWLDKESVKHTHKWKRTVSVERNIFGTVLTSDSEPKPQISSIPWRKMDFYIKHSTKAEIQRVATQLGGGHEEFGTARRKILEKWFAGITRPQIQVKPFRTIQSGDSQRATSPMFKGVELYSWRVRSKGEWIFKLLPGTNRLKFSAEIIGNADCIRGVEALKKRLALLAPGENVSWFVMNLQMGYINNIIFGYPDKKTVTDLVEYAKSMDVSLIYNDRMFYGMLVEGYSITAPYAKGIELFSWKEKGSDEWVFKFILGQNWLNYNQVLFPFGRIYGFKELRKQLALLPDKQDLRWYNGSHIFRDFKNLFFAVPNGQVMSEIYDLCKKSGVKLVVDRQPYRPPVEQNIKPLPDKAYVLAIEDGKTGAVRYYVCAEHFYSLNLIDGDILWNNGFSDLCELLFTYKGLELRAATKWGLSHIISSFPSKRVSTSSLRLRLLARDEEKMLGIATASDDER